MIQLDDLRTASGGQLFGDIAATEFPDFALEPHSVERGQLFVAIKAGTDDGHRHIETAIQRGAGGILCQEPPMCDVTGATVIMVGDTVSALRQWSAYVLRQYGTTVIGVLGTIGKSSAREAITAVLSARYDVYNGSAPFSGRCGLPLGLGQLEPTHQIAVLELASGHLGEMGDLSGLAQPAVVVVTNLETTYHVTKRIQEARQAIKAIPQDGTAVLNYDDAAIRELQSDIHPAVISYGSDIGGGGFGADLLAHNIRFFVDKTGFDLRYGAGRFKGHWVPLLGQPGLYGALAGLTTGMLFDISLPDGLRALTSVMPLPGHLNLLDGVNGSLLVDDTHSAVPSSTLAALDLLEMIPLHQERRIFVLGDIAEMGEQAGHAYCQIGQRAAHVADLFVTRGELAAIAGRAARDEGLPADQTRLVYSHSDAARCIQEFVQPGDVILVKGDAQARMEHVIARLLVYPDTRTPPPFRERTRVQAYPLHPTWIELDLEATAHNIRAIKERVGPDVAVMAVVKANAYGHGAVPIGVTALCNGAEMLGVGSLDEALGLRGAGINAPLLILGHMPVWAGEQAVLNDFTITVYDEDSAHGLNRTAHELKRTLKVHVKVDSGLGRLGLLPQQLAPFVRILRHMENLELDGIFTTFSAANSLTEMVYTREQLHRFRNALDGIRAAGISIRYVHAANSAALLSHPDSYFNMVRLGLVMHGLHPSPDVPCPSDLHRTLTWKTIVTYVRTLPAGSFVGFGKAYQTQEEERLAIIPVGYASGFRCAPRNWGEVLIRGQHASIVGQVGMDQTTIYVSHIPDIRVGDEVVLIGRQGNAEITVEDIARRLETLNYEVTTSIPARIPRLV